MRRELGKFWLRDEWYRKRTWRGEENKERRGMRIEENKESEGNEIDGGCVYFSIHFNVVIEALKIIEILLFL